MCLGQTETWLFFGKIPILTYAYAISVNNHINFNVDFVIEDTLTEIEDAKRVNVLIIFTIHEF